MKTLRIAALAVAVSGVFTLGAKAGTDTNNWWDVTFDDKLGLCDLENQTVGPDGAMVVLTNQTIVHDAIQVSEQTWSSGIWYTQDGDETIVTNSYNPTNTYKAYGSDLCLKLDTQGNDLTWRVDPTNTMADSRTALVDADLYLVGSDSPPDASDFDPSDAPDRVQTAIYLKNETDEDTGETTNSVLCVYVYDADGEQNYWQELKGVKVEDNSWASVKVVVDHAKVIDPQNPYPVVQVFVNGVKMTARDGDADFWTAANSAKSQTAGRVSSVAFRGTGAVDNFVGKLVETTFDKYDFTAEVYMNGTLVAQGTEGNVTRVVPELEAKEPYTFKGFLLSDFDYVEYETRATWALSKIEIIDPSTGAIKTYSFGWNGESQAVVPPEGMPETEVFIETDEDYGTQTGGFSVTAPTAGATEDSVIAKIYFDPVPEDGQFKLTASQNVGTAPADQIFNTNSLAVTEATFTYAQTLTVDGTSYVLSKVVPGTAPAGAITVAYTSPNVVVTVPLTDQIAEGTYNVAAATYVEGTIAEGKLVKLVSDGQGGYDLVVSDPPVAIIVADSGAKTNEYATLAAAVEAVQDGETVVLVSTIANESVHYTGTAAFTIDLNGQTWNYLDGETGNWAAFKNNGATVTFKDSSESGTGKIYCNGDGFCIWSRTGSVVIESGSFVNNSHEDYAIYIGTDDANFVGGVPPTITITGGSFVNEDNAPYNNKPAWSRLVLNVMNSNATTRTLVKTELIQVSGGSYSWDPALGDDNMGGSFVAEGYKSVYDDTTGLYNVVPDVNTVEITFMNGATTLYTTQIVENAAVAYVGETPEKEGTAQYSYTFAGWSTTDGGEALESLPDATANATYYAVFTESVNQYKVEWIVDGDRTTNEWAYGATPSYGAKDPTKESTDATNFTFKAWNPEVVAVTGFASYTATWTETARTYAITFQTNGVDYATVDAEWHATGYAPADPAAPEGKVFKGWALSTAPTTVLDTLPEVSGAATYVAVFDDDAVEVHVNPGDGLDTIENAPAPIEFTAAGLCKIAFKAPAAGKYVLMTSETVNGTYLAEGTPVEFAEGALVELTETTAGTTKFFKIGYEK